MICIQSLRRIAIILVGWTLILMGRPAIAAAPSQDIIRFGAVISLSGSQAHLSQQLLRGYQLAVRK